jgi:hypothetical protein
MQKSRQKITRGSAKSKIPALPGSEFALQGGDGALQGFAEHPFLAVGNRVETFVYGAFAGGYDELQNLIIACSPVVGFHAIKTEKTSLNLLGGLLVDSEPAVQ